MTARRLAALSAGSVLLVLFLFADSPRELSRRAAFLVRSSRTELALRRAGGSGAAFDRQFFVFVESLRRRLPRGVRGVAIFTPGPTPQELYLASYQLAPVPVLLAPKNVPPRWLAAAYRVPLPAGWRVLAQVPGGALASPP